MLFKKWMNDEGTYVYIFEENGKLHSYSNGKVFEVSERTLALGNFKDSEQTDRYLFEGVYNHDIEVTADVDTLYIVGTVEVYGSIYFNNPTLQIKGDNLRIYQQSVTSPLVGTKSLAIEELRISVYFFQAVMKSGSIFLFGTLKDKLLMPEYVLEGTHMKSVPYSNCPEGKYVSFDEKDLFIFADIEKPEEIITAEDLMRKYGKSNEIVPLEEYKKFCEYELEEKLDKFRRVGEKPFPVQDNEIVLTKYLYDGKDVSASPITNNNVLLFRSASIPEANTDNYYIEYVHDCDVPDGNNDGFILCDRKTAVAKLIPKDATYDEIKAYELIPLLQRMKFETPEEIFEAIRNNTV